jgi:hypothetical protein
VRAIEAGHFGGISQSRPNSPAPSYKLPPSTDLTDWGNPERSGSPLGSSNDNAISPPTSLPPSKKKPSPRRLQPFDADLNPAVNFGNGTYLTALSSPQSSKSSVQSVKSAKSGRRGANAWVSSLDVHFSRPTTPTTSEKERPASYLPRLQFPKEIRKGSHPLSSPSAFDFDLKPESTSIVPRNATLAPLSPQVATHEPPKSPSKLVESAPQTPSPAVYQQSSLLPISDDASHRSSRSSSKSYDHIPVPATPRSPGYFPPVPRSPSLPGANGSLAAENERWSSVLAMVRQPIVSKRTVSVYQPKSIGNQSLDAPHGHSRATSGASSIYSIEGSILDDDERRGSQSSGEITKQRSRSRSTLHERSRSSSSGREQSGSIQHRATDSENQHESPFSNINAITTPSHSVNSSFSDTQPEISSRTQQPDLVSQPTLGLNFPFPEPGRLSVMTGTGRDHRASLASQGSIGDFYDAYYRLSTMEQRASVASQTSNVPGGRRPPPLNFSRLGGETIVEQPSPAPSPMFHAGAERFPEMI